MIVALTVCDLDRGGIPCALDSFPPEEIVAFVGAAQDWRATKAAMIASGEIAPDSSLDTLHFTSLSGGQYYEITAMFL